MKRIRITEYKRIKSMESPAPCQVLTDTKKSVKTTKTSIKDKSPKRKSEKNGKRHTK